MKKSILVLLTLVPVVAGYLINNVLLLPVIGRLAILFESQPNYAGRATMTAMQVIALIVMILVFMFGYIWRKNKNKNDREFS